LSEACCGCCDAEEQLKRFREKHVYKETVHEEPTYEPTFQGDFRLSLEAGIHHVRDPERREATWKGIGWCFFEAYSAESKVQFEKTDVTGRMFIKECWEWNFSHKFLHVSLGIA
jgi:hypothetical protein